MRSRLWGAVGIAFLAAGCGSERGTADDEAGGHDVAVPVEPDEAGAAPAPSATETRAARPAAMTVAPLLGEKIARAQWSKAANRASCAPLGLKSDAKAGGKPRAATFSGGWAVAFDQPDRRSAYGFAGVGTLPDDKLDFAVLVDQLARRWPHIRRWEAGDNLPAGSAAGYGLEGFKAYPPGSSGYGQQSLAYLRIPGQQCLYNAWSKLGRDHLERMLSEMVVLKP